MSNELTPEEIALLEADRTGAEAPEPEKEPEPEPEKAEQKPEPEKQVETKTEEPAKPPEGFVPHGALHEERMRRKELQQKLSEVEEKLARYDERLKILGEGKKQPEPSFDEDPLLYHKTKIDRLEGEVSKITGENLNNLRSEIETLRMQQMISRQETAFERTTPDYRDALGYYVKARAETISELGYDDEEAREFIANELQQATHRAIQSGKNPAEVVYRMAQKSGYKNAKPDNKVQDTKNLDTLKKAEVASKSLSDASGKAKGELTADVLAEMSEEEFAKISREDFKKALGG